MRKRLPSPSMVVAVVALFVALGGTAVALNGTNTVHSSDIVNGAVKSQDVANAAEVGGVLGGEVLDVSNAGGGHGFAISPIGLSGGAGATLGSFVAPVDLTIRDLSVNAGSSDLPAGASIAVSLNPFSGRSSFISCTIPAGKHRCNTGSEKAEVTHGARITGFLSVDGTFSSHDVSFGYRLVP